MSDAAKNRFMRLQALYRSGDIATAGNAVAAALRASPNDPNLLHLAAQVAEARNEGPRAVMMYRRALAAYPGWFEATYNLARALGAQSEHGEAIALMEKLSVAHPGMPTVWEGLARLCQQKGDLPTALAHWQKVLALSPADAAARAQCYLLSRQLCDWSVPLQDVGSLTPQAVTVLADDPALQKKAALRYAEKKFRGIAPLPPGITAKTPREKLRIGYLSSDFHAHATAYLMAELFELHDRSLFEVFAYSYGVDDESSVRSRLQKHAGHFIDLANLTAAEAAARIHGDGLDVLIDLKGHTRGSCLEILAYRPTPVQVHWLGYPGTLGVPFMDYFVGDNITIPEGYEDYFTEKIIRLPHCYQINDRQRAIGQTRPRSAYGLPENALVLASFNQTYKITPDIFSLWCGIMKGVPETALWLYQSNAYAPENLRRAAETHGVDPERLVFAPPLPLPEHLARYAHADLALDTFPVGGHTTTSDALWAGVPVVAMAGKSFVARVAASVLTAAGLPELVTADMDEYKNLILRLLQDSQARQGIKNRLKERRLSLPLFDTPSFVKNWERVLEEIAKRHCP